MKIICDSVKPVMQPFDFFYFYIFLLKNYRNSKIYKSASRIPRGRI